MSLETIIFWGVTAIYALLALAVAYLDSLHKANNPMQPDGDDQDTNWIIIIIIAISCIAYAQLIKEVWL